MTRNQILLEAQSLSAEDRNALIEDLRQSGEDFTPEQLAEARRRIEAVDRGELGTLPGEQVMQEVLQSLRRR
ncbi:addiction module protein [Humisphaera borealis]|uniref:Addiction module protein n=1 Tax=Humisphaera borealis TaxID=2807512 RepID=A0A7M2WZC8_9BACT|nr:addiction module protein [Humisphaera borealis]QOV90858.1 addiction module protein [Humisphaera borealis]